MTYPKFVFFEKDGLVVPVDKIHYFRALDEGDLDIRYGQLRAGIPQDAVTEVHMNGGTHYLVTPLHEVVSLFQAAYEVVREGA